MSARAAAAELNARQVGDAKGCAMVRQNCHSGARAAGERLNEAGERHGLSHVRRRPDPSPRQSIPPFRIDYPRRSRQRRIYRVDAEGGQNRSVMEAHSDDQWRPNA